MDIRVNIYGKSKTITYSSFLTIMRKFSQMKTNETKFDRKSYNFWQTWTVIGEIFPRNSIPIFLDPFEQILSFLEPFNINIDQKYRFMVKLWESSWIFFFQIYQLPPSFDQFEQILKILGLFVYPTDVPDYKCVLKIIWNTLIRKFSQFMAHSSTYGITSWIQKSKLYRKCIYNFELRTLWH